MEETKLLAKVKEVLEWSYCFIIAVALALLVRYYLGTPTLVKQPSMYPTLKQDQRLFLSRWNRTKNRLPKRGDIITFEAPTQDFVQAIFADLDNPTAEYEYNPPGWFTRFRYYVLEINKKSYIKRVIGLPGEHVKIEDNKVYINGKLLNEPYLVDGMITNDLQRNSSFYGSGCAGRHCICDGRQSWTINR